MALTPERMELAQKNFSILIAMLEQKQLKYSIEENRQDFSHVCIRFTGKDLPMTLHLLVRADRQLVSLFSPMPFLIDEEHRNEAAVAVTVANHGLTNGSFDLNMQDGSIRFRLTTAFMETTLSPALFEYLLYVSADTIDRYNDRFMMLNNGEMDLQTFISAEHKGC